MSDELINTSEAAKRLGRTRQQIGYYCRQKILTAQKMGRDWIITVDEKWQDLKDRIKRGA